MIILLVGPALPFAMGAEPELIVTNAISPDHATIIFQGHFPRGASGKVEEKLVYAMRSRASIKVTAERWDQTQVVELSIMQGQLKELVLALEGEGEVMEVQGEGIRTWGVRRGTEGQRSFVVQVEPVASRSNFTFTVTSRRALSRLPAQFSPLVLAPADPTFFDGFVQVESGPGLEVVADNLAGITPIEATFFPGTNNTVASDDSKPLTFRFGSGGYRIRLTVSDADPEARKIRFTGFRLVGEVGLNTVSFILTGTVAVRNPRGGTLDVLSGAAGLTSLREQPGMRLELAGETYRLRFQTNGDYPIDLRFDARINEMNGVRQLNFSVISSALRPVTLRGLPVDSRVEFAGSAAAQPIGGEHQTYLPASGAVQVTWQTAQPSIEGKLFIAVNGLMQVGVSPGLVRQTGLLQYKVLQGELREVVIALEGSGEVTRVQGEQLLSWKVEPAEGNPRRLTIQLNQPQKESAEFLVQTQTPLGTFPLRVKPLRLVPENALRYGGHLQVVNEGAVRLEIITAPGLAQISPARLPAVPIFAPPPSQQQTQAFAFRFSGGAFDLEIQADHVLPEVGVSELLAYHLGETETAIQAEFELEIREAPLREFEISVPAGFAVASLRGPDGNDYTLSPNASGGTNVLKIQFTPPLQGRHVIELRLTRNHTNPPPVWVVPPIRPLHAKSVRGFIGLTAEAGLRLGEVNVAGLTEVAPAFFPRALKDLQLAYRLRDENWTVTVDTLRQALSVQVDALHLFSIGEGLTFGSTVLNYLIAGAPIGVLRVAASSNYANLEFVGREIRDWKNVPGGYEVHLHTPVQGTYSLLATYDLPFNSRGAELTFDGLQPLGVQSEQGHIIIASAYQFQTQPVLVSSNLVALESAEVPAEYRLLFDTPMLAAYQYTARPYTLRLQLVSLGQGETVNQVIDRATFHTRVSSEGQVVTDAHYFLKSQGHAHLRLTIPAPAALWSARVKGVKVAPIVDGTALLIPLPQDTPPNAVVPIDLQLAQNSPRADRAEVMLPRVAAPLILAQWEVEPDAQHRLEFRSGNASPTRRAADTTGFAWLLNLLRGQFGTDQRGILFVGLGALVLGGLLCRWASRPGTPKWGSRNIAGTSIGVISLLLAGAALVAVWMHALATTSRPAGGLTFLLPVQEPESNFHVSLSNHRVGGFAQFALALWPAYLALALWVYGSLRWEGGWQRFTIAVGWLLLFWAALKLPQGGRYFFVVAGLFVFFHLLIPLWRRQRNLLPKSEPPPELAPGSAVAAVLILAFLGAGNVDAAAPDKVPVLQSIHQTAQVQKEQVKVQARIRWEARLNQSLDFLRHPAVLTRADVGPQQLKVVRDTTPAGPVYRLIAQENGSFELEFSYEVAVTVSNTMAGFGLLTHPALVNLLEITIDRPGVEIVSDQAVSIKALGESVSATNQASRFELVLTPSPATRINWRPRHRDARSEKPIFYAESVHLFIPTAGLIEGLHEFQIRLAQGQLEQLTFTTPTNVNITDARGDSVINWRFDPDTRKCEVQLRPQARPFAVRLFSQTTTTPLPYTQELGLITVEQAARETALVALGTGNEVQLGTVEVTSLSMINPEDFPSALVNEFSAQVPGLALRRAWRSMAATARITLEAAAIEPDIRVNAQQTLSMSQDRTVLGAQLDIQITRAGVFKLSFALPVGMDLESLSGAALSHWTELRTDSERIITLHLHGKTEGDQRFNIGLAGPGVATATNWAVPRVALREATKQTGQLVIAPEQGMRLQVNVREGITQLDPATSGIRQKAVLAFRILQPTWRLTLDISQVPPWIQAVILQDVTARDAQLRVVGLIEYTIENAGVKSLFIQVPAVAEAVRFTGEHIGDTVKTTPPGSTNVAIWEIKLDRRVIGPYRLQVHYQYAIFNGDVVIANLQARGVDLQRNYVTVRASGRIQLGVVTPPANLVPVDWRSLPATLRDQAAHEGIFTYRAIDPDYALPVRIARHSTASLLPARVESIALSSSLSASGAALTQVRLSLQPGDKRLLRIKLPPQARFWFGFVNGTGVWPWEDAGQFLIPLEPSPEPDQPASVEFFYSLPGPGGTREVTDFRLNGPEFDLPLQKITWEVFLPPNQKLADWTSVMQLQERHGAIEPGSVDMAEYLQGESSQQQEQAEQSANLIALGNGYLNDGNQQQARRAFRAAWNLSQHDDAFNEDARVQLQNVKLQQALVGLNYRRDAAFRDKPGVKSGATTNAPLQTLIPGEQPVFTPQQLKAALEKNSADDNEALLRLAEHLVQQQEAAQSAPEAIRASLPAPGTRLTFIRSLQTKPFAPLSIELETDKVDGDHTGMRFTILLGVFIVVLSGVFFFRPRAS